MVSPLIEDGCVVVEGDRIVAVGATRDINPPHIDEDIDGVLMPGLINAHTHLELTNVPRPGMPGTFQDWLLTTMGATREADPNVFAAKREAAVREGIAQCLKFGVTCVGDISQNVEIVRPILANGPIRSVSFGECLGLGERRARFERLLENAIETSITDPAGLMDIGVAPHAPYTVDIDGYRQIESHFAKPLNATTHLAETSDEAAFVMRREGPFKRLYETLGFDPGPGEFFFGSMFAGLTMYGGLSLWRWLLVHMNYCEDIGLQVLASGRGRVVWCPRTHEYFGHPPHRWREMRERGIAVCVGTDSCASSPDLNVVDDLRLVHRQCPEESPAGLWAMVTTEAQHALRWRGDTHLIGRLSKNALADLTSFPTRSTDPLREILDTPAMLPNAVWIAATLASSCGQNP